MHIHLTPASVLSTIQNVLTYALQHLARNIQLGTVPKFCYINRKINTVLKMKVKLDKIKRRNLN